jgi:hypothetical protein
VVVFSRQEHALGDLPVRQPFADELQDALSLVRLRRQQIGGRHRNIESMRIVSRKSRHFLPKAVKPCEGAPICGQKS